MITIGLNQGETLCDIIQDFLTFLILLKPLEYVSGVEYKVFGQCKDNLLYQYS